MGCTPVLLTVGVTRQKPSDIFNMFNSANACRVIVTWQVSCGRLTCLFEPGLREAVNEHRVFSGQHPQWMRSCFQSHHAKEANAPEGN
jgi:hypothetical protein